MSMYDNDPIENGETLWQLAAHNSVNFAPVNIFCSQRFSISYYSGNRRKFPTRSPHYSSKRLPELKTTTKNAEYTYSKEDKFT